MLKLLYVLYLLHGFHANFVDGFMSGSNLFLLAVGVLAITIITAYLITSNGTAQRYTEEASGLPLGWFTGRDSDSVRHNTYMYALYLRCKDYHSVRRSTF